MEISDFYIDGKPNYIASAGEIDAFSAAYQERIPVMLKGPTGCGKTRFVEHMAWTVKKPLITISCHEDMTASDIIGRYLLDSKGTYWQDGPLTFAVRNGGICYLDEIVEARQDTTVVIHSLTDDRRVLPIEKKGELVRAHKDFHLVISYNPGYQSVVKDLKESTKQRFCALDFTYPSFEVERDVVCSEASVPISIAEPLVKIASKSRNLKGAGLTEGISTRMIIHAAKLTNAGLTFDVACEIALVNAITDEAELRDTLRTTISSCT